MNRYLSVTAILLWSVFARGAYAIDLLSSVAADRLGVEEAWHRQIATIGGAASIVDLQLWVQQNTLREFIEVVRADEAGKIITEGEVLRRISTDMKASSGLPIGKAEAERLARLDVLKLKRRGIPAAIRSVSIKQVRLYLLGSDGGLSAYDAETGEVLWSLRVGEPELGYGRLGISDGYITVINGTTMYRVIADDRMLANSTASGGRPIKPVVLDNVPLIGATNTEHWVMIPNIRSGVESYSYEDIPGQPGFEIFSGQLMDKPTRFPGSSLISFTTEQGFFYVMDTREEPTTLFRLKTDGVSSGGATPASGDRFFLGSSAGRVYAIHASRAGEVLWNQSYAEPFYQAPFVANDRVLISSSFGNLHCIDASAGTPIWAAPSRYIESVFAKAGGFYFARSTVGILVAIDPESGQQIKFGSDVFVDRVVRNMDTDRLYLVSHGGTIQCLRPQGAEQPTFLRDEASVANSSKKQTATANTEKKPAEDPFGAAAGVAPAAANADPFGAAEPTADPFGAGAADPFGGDAGGADAADDPFGG